VDEKLFKQVIQLTVNNPRVYLVKKYFMALVKYPSKHGMDNRVTRSASSV